jgi:hypothetical protein
MAIPPILRKFRRRDRQNRAGVQGFAGCHFFSCFSPSEERQAYWLRWVNNSLSEREPAFLHRLVDSGRALGIGPSFAAGA